MLITVEHLTGWPVAVATKESLATIVAKFIESEFMHPFGPLKNIISDNTGCFIAAAITDFMKKTWN